MNIRDIYDKLQEESFVEQLNGELNLEGNCIIWSFNLNDNTEEIDMPEEDFDEDFGYEATSPYELLQDAYMKDLQSIEQYIGEFDEYGDWTYSDPEVGDTTISFKIF